MKLHEVLVLPGVVSGELWFRPVGRVLGDDAFFLGKGLCRTNYGVVPHIPPVASILAGEWEAVTPDHVLGGVK